MTDSDKLELNKLTEALQDCRVDEGIRCKDVIFDEVLDQSLISKWPKLKMKVPTIFLHKTVDFAQHVKKLLKLGIHFYQPYLGTNYTKIFCETFKDHKGMLKYFDKHQLPYHTFGHPDKRKMKVVIRGLPVDIGLDSIKHALKDASIPLIRLHKMHMKVFAKERDLLILAVVPYSDEGKNILRVKQILEYPVKMEPPLKKTSQCHRCQKWGHSQRYCHGQIKCVKCAGDHFSKKCTRDPNVEPPTCTNCGGNHTASYRECFFCPDSTEYKKNLGKKKEPEEQAVKPRELVTNDNYEIVLYRKVKYIPKHKEAILF